MPGPPRLLGSRRWDGTPGDFSAPHPSSLRPSRSVDFRAREAILSGRRRITPGSRVEPEHAPMTKPTSSRVSFSFEPPPRASRADKRWVILAVFVFGIVGVCAGFHWLSTGEIVIRQGESHSGRASYSGRRAAVPRPASRPDAPVAGSIASGNVLFYPLCVLWIGLGVSMVALSALCAFSSKVLYFILAAFSCLALLLLAFGTVGAAIWLGP